MKILIIITGNWGLDKSLKFNIDTLNNYMLESNNIIEYAGISCYDDFDNYKDIVNFKYKEIINAKILSRLLYFINKYKDTLDYDWYVRFRPEVRLFETINFNTLCINSINARARVYHGPKKIKYGSPVGGTGKWINEKESSYKENNETIILDDILIIFHNNIINKYNFEYPTTYSNKDGENEWVHNKYYDYNKIPKHVIGIDMMYINKENEFAYSGHINC